ncbi:hypothetical protein T440DRAFT_474959 [Plenodomus tracheiphilus IPT5]|uniref:Uncharacterized protein n=1 Tax=Plenodomus tracheiphilus IPT5 TaxID=1408161 RepID=A0A6A7BJV3_9PLEO|nr:hypothetical protein T440DRAFT_474959 [Plenodomus tracheiphilus IPT5]
MWAAPRRPAEDARKVEAGGSTEAARRSPRTAATHMSQGDITAAWHRKSATASASETRARRARTGHPWTGVASPHESPPPLSLCGAWARALPATRQLSPSSTHVGTPHPLPSSAILSRRL